MAGPAARCARSPLAAGPVDAGPTVLTLRDVLDDLFASAGRATKDHVTLTALPILARHYWADGTRLDLTHDPAENSAAIATAFGTRAAREFDRFSTETRALFHAFDAPIMRSPRPRVLASARAALATRATLPWLVPGRSLDSMLQARLSDPRLRQLFGRYATYVGGNPMLAPAVLGLVWQAEAAGVWAVQGGMAGLAQALAALFQRLGGTLRLNTPRGAHCHRQWPRDGSGTGRWHWRIRAPDHLQRRPGSATLPAGPARQSPQAPPNPAAQPVSARLDLLPPK